MPKRKYTIEEKLQICIDKQQNGLSNSQFKAELIEYIEYYNTKRIKTKLKTSPVAYRLKNAA